MDNYICPECGNVMYGELNDNYDLFLECSNCGSEYSENDFEQCVECGDYHHISEMSYNENNDTYTCYECE